MAVLGVPLGMPRRLAVLAASVLLLGGTGVAFFGRNDPVQPIAIELCAATADPANHAGFADLIRSELASVGRRQVATFAMPCFWSGEAHFGGLDGVYRTTPGYQDGKEVVRVEFDPAVTSADDLLNAPDPAARDNPGACRWDPARVAASRDGVFRPDDEYPAWYVHQTDDLKFVPLTPAQTGRVDACVRSGMPYTQWLSPGQLALLAKIRAKPDAGWTEYAGSNQLWDAMRKSAAK